MKIALADGAGGAQTQKLLGDLLGLIKLRSVNGGLGLDDLDDSGTIPFSEGQIVFTTDGHTVDPLFFPGGDIGRLAVSGTVNDVAVMGAEPLALSLGVVIEEGLEKEILEKVFASINAASEEAGVAIIAGDTKVVEKGAVDKLIITTSGIGIAKKLVRDNGLEPGDKLIVTGYVGNHGVALLSKREGYSFETTLSSDCAPLNKMLQPIWQYRIHGVKDPTRGGIAMVLNEMAEKSGVHVLLQEKEIPVHPEVEGACAMLGLDPFTLANEGKAVIAVHPEDAASVLELLRKHPYGEKAAVIGEVLAKPAEERSKVLIQTDFGKRILRAPVGELVPRIC